MSTEIKDFAQLVRELAEARGLSVARVGYAAYDPDVKGTNPDTLKSVMAGRRQVTPVLMEHVARVLEVTPDTFPEYRLAMAREALDESVTGLEQALATLERVERATQSSATEHGRRATAQQSDSPQPAPTSRRGRRTQAGD